MTIRKLLTVVFILSAGLSHGWAINPHAEPTAEEYFARRYPPKPLKRLNKQPNPVRRMPAVRLITNSVSVYLDQAQAKTPYGTVLDTRYAERLSAGVNAQWDAAFKRAIGDKATINVQDISIQIQRGKKTIYTGRLKVKQYRGEAPLGMSQRRAIGYRTMVAPKPIILSRGKTGNMRARMPGTLVLRNVLSPQIVYEARPKPGLLPILKNGNIVKLSLRAAVNGVSRKFRLPNTKLIFLR